MIGTLWPIQGPESRTKVGVSGHSGAYCGDAICCKTGDFMPTLPAAAKPGTPVILGIPFDANSSWLRGAAGAPPIIRVSFRSDSSNAWTETGVDLGAEGAYCDAGDLKFTFHEPFAAIENRVGELLDKGLRVVSAWAETTPSRCRSCALSASASPD